MPVRMQARPSASKGDDDDIDALLAEMDGGASTSAPAAAPEAAPAPAATPAEAPIDSLKTVEEVNAR